MVGAEFRQSHRWGFACCEDCMSAMVLALVFVVIPGAVALGLLGRLVWEEAQPYADRRLTPAQACEALEMEGRRRAEARRADLMARLTHIDGRMDAGVDYPQLLSRRAFVALRLAETDSGRWLAGWRERHDGIVRSRHGVSCLSVYPLGPPVTAWHRLARISSAARSCRGRRGTHWCGFCWWISPACGHSGFVQLGRDGARLGGGFSSAATNGMV